MATGHLVRSFPLPTDTRNLQLDAVAAFAEVIFGAIGLRCASRGRSLHHRR